MSHAAISQLQRLEEKIILARVPKLGLHVWSKVKRSAAAAALHRQVEDNL